LLTFQVESYSKVRDEVAALTIQHYEEIALFKDKIKLDPDYERYEVLEEKGILCFITVRDSDVGNKIVGYHISLVMPHLHYKSTLIGITDIFFLDKEYRQGLEGLKLFKFFEEEMLRRGVKEIMAGTKLRLNLGKMFTHLGWIETDHMYAKWIGD